MKTLFSLLFLILFPIKKVTNADLGVPYIQAVCKVTLKSGKSIEGFISFGNGGFDYKYRPHGFCFVYEDDKGRKRSLLYLENKSTRNYPKKETTFNEKDNSLVITKTDVEKYKLTEEMVIYTKIPLGLLLENNSNTTDNGKILIPTKEITSVELLKKPSKKSLAIIKIARGMEATFLANEEVVDYFPPIWFHEIIEDKKQIEYLSKFF